ncbi:MAG: YdcF family protein [Synergistaceae bacterium]|nr:YdcF family protein [Synergistaceae bacterium]
MVTPPGCFFVLLFLLPLIGVIKTKERTTKRIFKLVLFIVALMYVLFTPLTAMFLMGYLESGRPVLQDDDRATLVVVPAGGGTHPVPGGTSEVNVELAEQSFQRLAEGVNVAKRHNWPLFYTGAYEEGDSLTYTASIRAQAALWGFEGEVVVETSSRNTWENMQEVAKAVEKGGYERLVISTTAYHMKRSLWMAKRHMPDIEIIPWSSGWRSTSDSVTYNMFAPSARAFYDSCAALREIVGLFAYMVFY